MVWKQARLSRRLDVSSTILKPLVIGLIFSLNDIGNVTDALEDSFGSGWNVVVGNSDFDSFFHYTGFVVFEKIKGRYWLVWTVGGQEGS